MRADGYVVDYVETRTSLRTWNLHYCLVWLGSGRIAQVDTNGVKVLCTVCANDW